MVMKLRRRQFLHLAAGAAALPAMSRIACALDYPSRPVRFVVGFPGRVRATDIVGRLIFAQALSERLGQQFIVGRPSREPAAIWLPNLVVRADPDGLHAPAGRFAERDQYNALRQAKFQYRPRHCAGRGHHAVSLQNRDGLFNPSFPATTIPEFIAYAEANPGKINMASAWQRHRASCFRRTTVHDDDRRRHGARGVSAAVTFRI